MLLLGLSPTSVPLLDHVEPDRADPAFLVRLPARSPQDPAVGEADFLHALRGPLGEHGRLVPHVEEQQSSRKEVPASCVQGRAASSSPARVAEHGEHHESEVETLVEDDRADVAGPERDLPRRLRASLCEHLLGFVDAHDRVAAVRERDRMAPGPATEVEHAADIPPRVLTSEPLDEVALGFVVLVSIERVVDLRVALAEDVHRSDSCSARRRARADPP